MFSLFLTVGLVSGEAVVRWLAPQTTLFPRYVESSEYPIEYQRGTELVHSRGRLWRFVYTTNRLGRRGCYMSPEDAAERKTVVVLGDSFTFGIGVQDSEVYTAVLNRFLGEGYYVLNGGVGGWGLDSQIKWYHEFGLPYGPEAVVLQFSANDPWDYAGVTAMEGDSLRHHPHGISKPAWQWFLSRSALFQKSHIYVLARRVYEQLVEDQAGAGTTRRQSGGPQGRYVRMLELFAGALNRAGVELFFISVTHRDPSSGVYRYDVERFPVIQAALARLQEQGHLTFVDLPLEEMKTLTGSPEGHQWGGDHHRIVGLRLAESIGGAGRD